MYSCCLKIINDVLTFLVPSGEIFKKQISNQWFKDGEELIRKNLRRKVISNKAKGVIVFIGDGMGISTVTAGRILDGQLKNQTGKMVLLKISITRLQKNFLVIINIYIL